MSGRFGIEMAGCACRANVMNEFADKEEKRVAGSRREQGGPPVRGVEAFRRNRKEGYAQKRSSRKTDQCTKRLVLPAQRRDDGSTGQRENVGRYGLPEWTDHSRACQSRRRGMFFAAMLSLDGDVNEFVVPAEQLAIRVRALWLVRHHGDHRRKFSDAHLPDM